VVQVPVRNIEGQVVSQIELNPLVFEVPLNQSVVHQAMVRQLTNARQGTVSTKTRGDVSGGGRKMYRQKGTGFARRGSRRSPILRGGGITFGPKPRGHRQAMPKKMRRLALRCLLSAKVSEEEMVVVDELAANEQKTKEMARILSNLGVDSSVLVVTAELDPGVRRLTRNLEETKTLPARLLNVIDLLKYRKLVITVGAVRVVEEVWAAETGRGGQPVT